MKTNQIRGIISTVLILAALGSLSTGAILYFLEYGMWLGFTRKFLSDTHAVSGLLTGTAAVFHLILNWRLYILELKSFRSEKNKKKTEPL